MTDSSETLDWAGGAGALGATMGGGRTALVEGTDWSCVSRVIIGMSGAVKRVLTHVNRRCCGGCGLDRVVGSEWVKAIAATSM